MNLRYLISRSNIYSVGDAFWSPRLSQAEGFQLEPKAFLLRCGPSGVAAWSAGTDVTYLDDRPNPIWKAIEGDEDI